LPVTAEEFDRGVQFWRSRPKWSQQFHNEFYAEMAAQNPNGDFTMQWWHRFLPHLQRWIATRGVSHAELTRNAYAALPALAEAWEQSVAPCLEHDITGVTWAQVAEFPAAVKPIKGVASPVFTSKFCHFLAPSLFPVIDNAAMGGATSYRQYFEQVQQEWATTPSDLHSQLRNGLAGLITPPLTLNYPMVNKVVEICIIGRAHGDTRAAPSPVSPR
jgi:hypothetical protein